MTHQEAIKVLTEMNKWRQAMPPYNTIPSDKPYTARQLSIAIDIAISVMKQNTPPS